MPSLNMDGPYVFTREEIDKRVTRIQCGNYALGKINKDNGNFIVCYVGRADYDLNDRLKQHVGEPYTHFKYSYATSPKDAFEKECNNYHDWKNLHNKIHPDRPSDSKNWKCPRCNKFDT